MSAIASEATIRIAYDGPALQSGTMDVRDLAPALLALSDLFDGANKVLNGSEREIQLRIRHDVKRGSFDVGIQIVQTWASKILSIFAADTASGAANLIEILGFTATTGLGLFKLVKWLRGRPVKKVELINDDDARLIIDGDEIVIKRKVAAVFNDVGVRRALSAAIMPLSREGIDSFELKTADGKEVVDRVEKKELPAFADPEVIDTAGEQITVNEFRQAYTLVAVTFKDGNKWRVSDGQNTINVKIEDAEFLERVNNHDISFAKDDVIHCDVRQEQTLTPGGLKTEVAIKRVIDHKRALRQTILQFKEASEGVPPTDAVKHDINEVLKFSAPQPNEPTTLPIQQSSTPSATPLPVPELAGHEATAPAKSNLINRGGRKKGPKRKR